MQPSEYKDLIDNGMALDRTEEKLISGMPAPVAYGFIVARRKANGGKRSTDNNLGDMFGGLFQ